MKPLCKLDAVDNLVSDIHSRQFESDNVRTPAEIRADLQPHLEALHAQWAADTAPGVGP